MMSHYTPYRLKACDSRDLMTVVGAGLAAAAAAVGVGVVVVDLEVQTLDFVLRQNDVDCKQDVDDEQYLQWRRYLMIVLAVVAGTSNQMASVDIQGFQDSCSFSDMNQNDNNMVAVGGGVDYENVVGVGVAGAASVSLI